ncbi:MAG: hypothetical protein KUG79_09305 [Pseudomonadales bacterium]|nr:hypothetical protein [Pseudomonadales bacterium]
MDIAVTLALGLAVIATACSIAALTMVFSIRKTLKSQQKQPDNHKNKNYAEIANMLSDGSMVWQRLMVQCDESSTLISGSAVQGTTRDNIGDWLLQLREFCKQSKNEVDHGYQLFATEAKKMTADEMAMQRPDMEKFQKEMKSNVAVISDQVEHIRRVLHGTDSVSNSQFKITLHKPQVMPHFLRKRQKIAELQRRHSSPAPTNTSAQPGSE